MEQTANPTIIKSPIPQKTVSGFKENPKAWVKKNIIKIILVLLAIGVILEVIFGGISLFSASGGKVPTTQVSGLKDASISLVPNKTSYRTGDEVEVDVRLFTGGYSTDSTDLVVKYDPVFLTPKTGTFAKAGTLYSEYPALQVDKVSNLIGISGITVPAKEGFNGAGVFAKLYFTALKDGQTQLSIDFQPGGTADSNVVLTGSTNDILGFIKNADILINGSDTGAPAVNNNSCDSFRQNCLDSSGNSGVQVCSGGSTKEGSCGYDAEFTTSCGVCSAQ